MSPPGPDQLTLSVPTDHVEVAASIDLAIELKLDWEDFELLVSNRSLPDVLDARDVDPARLASVHLPPGLRTRHRKVGMAATAANVGPITDFVHTQLDAYPAAFLVLHTPREFEYGPHLRLLSRLCALTERELAIENPPDESSWYRPEDLAFFGYAGETIPALSDLYLTVDSGHLPAESGGPTRVDDEAVEAIVDRISSMDGVDVSAVEDGFRTYLARAGPPSLDGSRIGEGRDRWTPLLKTLLLCGDRVKSVHFNDPRSDGIPDLPPRGRSDALEAVRSILVAEDVRVVLEPDRALYADRTGLGDRIDAVRDWLATG